MDSIIATAKEALVDFLSDFIAQLKAHLDDIFGVELF